MIMKKMRKMGIRIKKNQEAESFDSITGGGGSLHDTSLDSNTSTTLNLDKATHGKMDA